MSRKRLMLMLGSVLVLGACGTTAEAPTESMSESAAVSDTATGVPAEVVTVDLINTEGETIGTVILSEEQTDSVTLRIEATDLPPGEHGFHIHETGMVELPDFESAGGHFNPTDATHGENSANGPHVGDLPNLMVAEDGTVEDEFILNGISLDSEAENSLADADGSSLVIHADPDDYETDPSGNSGNRIAAAVLFAPQ